VTACQSPFHLSESLLKNCPAVAVPGVIVPRESNYPLNPLHPAFKRINIGKPITVETELQLIKP
jgi:RES domain-containing protein